MTEYLFRDILTIKNGRNQKKVENPNGKYPIYGSGGIMGYADDFLCDGGTVVIGRKGTINKPIYVDEPFWNVDTAFGLCANQELLFPKYLYYFCENYNFEKLSTTVTIPSLTKANLLNIKISLPPLSEQKRVAAILDKVDGIIRKRKQSIKLLDELVKAKFVEMFGDLETNEKGWEILNLENISEIKIGPFGTMLHQSDYIKNGYPVINPSNISGNEIIPDVNYTISDAKYNSLLTYKLEIGDIVLGRRGEMGRCAVAKISNMLCGTGCVKIRLKDEFEPDFIQFIIASPFYKKLLSNNSVGITMQNLNMDILAGLPIYKIPYACQKKFILISSKISVIKRKLNLAIQDSMKVKGSLIRQFFTIDK